MNGWSEHQSIPPCTEKLSGPDNPTMQRFTGLPRPVCSASGLFFYDKVYRKQSLRLFSSIHGYSEGSLGGSGPQHFRRLTKTAVTRAPLAGRNAFQPQQERGWEAAAARSYLPTRFPVFPSHHRPSPASSGSLAACCASKLNHFALGMMSNK